MATGKISNTQTAERSIYDNTESGLTATNVQDALDELSNQSIQSMSVNATLSAGSDHLTVTAVIPSGYKFLAWSTVSTSNAILTSDLFWESGNTVTIYFSPTPSANIPVTVYYLVCRVNGGSVSNPEAVSIAYNNTTSGLSATNVQSALDEVKSKIDFRSDVYTGVSGEYLFLSRTPGSKYRLISVYDGDWDNGNWLAKGIMQQGNSYAVFFDKTLTNATIRVNSVWVA